MDDSEAGSLEQMTLSDSVDRPLGQEKLLAKLASFFAALALLLSAILGYMA